MRKYAFLLLGLLAISSCKKGKADFTIRGTITDATFSNGLSGASIKLYEVEAGGSGSNLIGNSTLSDGTYSFTFPRNQAESYTLIVEKANYFTLNETIWFSDLTISEDNVRNYNTTAKSWVNLRFVNQSALPTDQLNFIKANGKTGCDECCDAAEQSLYGDVDTSIICINDGNTIYSYNYVEVGTLNTGTKSVNTVAFDTTELLLNY